MGFWTGNDEVRKNVSTLRGSQEGIYKNATSAAKHRGGKGVHGQAADIYRDLSQGPAGEYYRNAISGNNPSSQFYQNVLSGQDPSSQYYRNNLSDNPSDLAAFQAPALRQYGEEIVPGLAEQFAGMGAGGLSSSGFQNSLKQGGVDLAERLGAIRANLRHSSAQGLSNMGFQGAQGLSNQGFMGAQGLSGLEQAQAQGLQGVGQQALGPYSQNMVTQQASPGFLQNASEGIGRGITAYATGGMSELGRLGAQNWWNSGASPKIPNYSSNMYAPQNNLR